MTGSAPPIGGPVLLGNDAPASRVGFLGGSDAAAVMGLSPWTTPLELWLEKTMRRQPPPPDPVKQRIFARGKRLEPVILEMLIDRLQEQGLKVDLIGTNNRYADQTHPWMRCEIDFELRVTGVVTIGGIDFELDDEVINGDCKSVIGFARRKWGEEETEDVPIEYAVQFSYGLGITGRRLCLVAALIGLDDVRIFWTVRDDEIIAGIREKCVKFWHECVLGDVQPDPLHFSDIKLLFPTDNGQDIEATPEIAETLEAYRSVSERIKVLEDKKETLKFELVDFISPNAFLKLEGRQIASWKGQRKTTFLTEDFKRDHPALYDMYSRSDVIRVLRLSKPKH